MRCYLHRHQGSRVSSGCRRDLDRLRHLLGAVVGQTQAHDGQHHGDVVDGTVLWLRLHLTGNLPFEEAEVSGSQPAQSDDHVC